MPAPEPREWAIQDTINDGLVAFDIYDNSESGNVLNDVNIWEIVDALVAMNIITANATVQSKRGAWSEGIERPEEV
jgi:hypothetical protein